MTRKLRGLLALAGICAMAPCARGGTYHWDVNGPATGSGGTTPGGAWNSGSASATNWNTDSSGGAGTFINNPTTSDDLILSAGSDANGAYTLTLSGTQYAKSLTFEDGAATVSGGTLLSLAGSATITVNSGVTGAISSAVGGAGTRLTKTGAGTLTLGGANTYAGATAVSNGTLLLKGSLASTALLTVNSGATLRYGTNDLLVSDVTLNGGTFNLDTYRDHIGTLTLSDGGQVLTAGIHDDRHLYITGAAGQINAAGTGNAIGCDIVICSQYGGHAGNRTQNIAVSDGGILDLLGRVKNVPPYGYQTYVGGVTKTGAGTLTLWATSTYTGSTLIEAGTLTVGGSGRLGGGAYAGAISNNGLFVYDSSVAQTLSGGISGTGSLIKANAGVLTLSGPNSYSGATIISNGTLAVNGGLSNSAVTVRNGGTLVPGSLSVNAMVCAGLVLVSGSALEFEFSGATNDTLISTGGLTVAGGGLHLYQVGGTTPFNRAGSYPLIQHNGGMSGGGPGALSVLNPQPGSTYTFTTNGNWIVLTIEGPAAGPLTWDGGGGHPSDGNGAWNLTNTNWWSSGGSRNSIWNRETANIGAGGSGNHTITVAGDAVADNLYFNTSSNLSYTLQGDGTARKLTLGYNLQNTVANSTNTVGVSGGTDALSIVLDGARTHFIGSTAGGGVLNVHAPISNTVAAAGRRLSLNANSVGVTFLNNTNSSFDGDIEVKGALGFASVGNIGGGPSALGAPTTGARGLVAIFASAGNNGSLVYTGDGDASDRTWQLHNFAYCALGNSGSGPLTLNGPVQVTGGYNEAGRYIQIFASSADLVLNGPVSCALTLPAFALWGGGTGVRTITLANPNSTFSNPVRIQDVTVSVPALALAGQNSPLGVNATIQIGNGASGGRLRYTGGGDLCDRTIELRGTTGGVTLQSEGTGALVLSGNLVNSGNGAKTLTLAGSNEDANELRGAVSDYSASARTSLLKDEAGRWILSGVNTHSGDSVVSNGLLEVNGSVSASTTLVYGAAGLGGTGYVGRARIFADARLVPDGLRLGDLVLENQAVLVSRFTASTSGVAIVEGRLSLPEQATVRLESLDSSAQPERLVLLRYALMDPIPDFLGWVVENGVGRVERSPTEVVLWRDRSRGNDWTSRVSGAWSESVRWRNGEVPSGEGCYALFTNGMAAACTVTNDLADLKIGRLVFGSAGGYDWTLAGSTLCLTNGAGDPGISVLTNRARVNVVLTGAQGLSKFGAGRAELSAASVYDGDTSIRAGEIKLVGGANRLPVTTRLMVAGNAVLDVNGLAQTVAGLSGVGRVADAVGGGSLAIVAGGTLQPGDGLGLGSLRLETSLTLSGGSTHRVVVAGSEMGDYGTVRVTNGAVALNNAALRLEATAAPDESAVLWLVVKDSPGAVSGTYAGLPAGASVAVGSRTGRVVYAADYDTGSVNGGNDIALLFFPTNSPVATLQDFETDSVPASWQAGPNSRLQTSWNRFKSGNLSLCWTWTNSGASLTFSNAPAFAGMTTAESLGFWVYNETPFSNRLMRVYLMRGGAVAGQCWYYLDFKGWRPLGMPYGQVGWSGAAVDGVRFVAPEGVSAGRIYFDYLNFRCAATLAADNQQPWVGPNAAALLLTPSTLFYSTHDLARNRAWLPALVPGGALTEDQLADMADVAVRTLPGVPAWPNTAANPATMAVIRGDIATNYCLRRRNGVLTGTPVGTGYNAPPGTLSVHDHFIRSHNQIVDNMVSANQPDGVELRQYFRDLAEHLVDQGFTEGNGNTSQRFADYGITREWPSRVWKMRDELAGDPLARDLALALCWSQASRELLNQSPSGDTDRTHCTYRYLFPSLSLFTDLGERHQRLGAFKQMMDTICGRDNGDPFSADGLGWHHSMVHYEYASYSIPVWFNAASALFDTGYRPAPATFERLKQYLTATMFACAGDLNMPGNMDARAGNIMNFGGYPAYVRQMAECGTPDNSLPVDPDLASIYLAFVNNAADAYVQKYQALGFQPDPMEGNLSLNGTWANIHRRDGWLVSLVGMNGKRNAYTLGNLEIYGHMMANNYGGYARNGSILVVSSGDPMSVQASGYPLDNQRAGWDWRLFPGATAMLRDPQDLFVPMDRTYFMRNYGSGGSFAGSTSLEGDGIWGHTHRLYRYAPGGTLHPIALNMQFNKSAFCFDNRITVLTSGIGQYTPDGNNPAHNTNFVTTLYQNSFAGDPASEPCWVDGAELASFPSEVLPATNLPHALVDNKGQGYYIPANQPPLRVTRRAQVWTYTYASNIVTTGAYATAYFDHGKIPSGTPGACAYTMLVRAGATGTAAFAASMADTNTAPHRILQQDANAHILWDRASRTTGYILFNPITVTAPGPLKSNNRPCYVMIREAGSRLRLSVASSDDTDGTSYQLALNGAWKLESTDSAQPITVVTNGSTTTLTIPYVNFLPIVVTLRAPAYYEQWAAAHRLAADSDLGDPDFDGDPNLIECALGTNPTNGQSVARLEGRWSGGKPVLQFPRVLAATDLVYVVEAAAQLTGADAWRGISTNQNGAWRPPDVPEIPAGNGTNWVVLPMAADGVTQRFMRLNVRR
jgi:autotransporter-associated beta strand protein